MIFAIVAILGLAFLGVFLYVYRWNVLNPNRSGSFTIDGLERTFIYHVPKNLKLNPKLIIIYHGSKLKAYMMQIFTGHEFDVLADADANTIVVYPQGYMEQWNDCKKNAPYPANQLNLDDVDFTENLIAYFTTTYAVNSREIYAVGYSNGGSFVTRLANKQPELFKGYAVINATLPVDENNKCQAAQKPISLIFFAGVKDPIVHYFGGEAFVGEVSYGFLQSVEQSLAYWQQINQCDTAGVATQEFKNKNGEITAIQTNYASASTAKKISFVKILDGGHTIPNRNFRIPIKVLGNMNAEVDVPEMIWDFFMSLK